MIFARTSTLSSLIVLFGAFCCWAQTGITLVGAGYFDPRLILRIAPGQVMTFLFSGAKTILPPGALAQRATQVPLPTALAGFSATISQVPPSKVEPLPIFSVQQVNNCLPADVSSPDCVVTALTVQIPFGLFSDYGRGSPFVHVTTVVISDGTDASKSFIVLVLPQNFHILTMCDTTMANPLQPDFLVACSSVVTHGDGTLVSAFKPAQIGEELVMYALGLGATSSMVAAGVPSPTPALKVLGHFAVTFAYSGGTVPALKSTPLQAPNPVFVGLTPGQVGLYQVNFIVEAPAGPIADCTGPDQANLTVSLTNDQSPSIDAARICVDATAPVMSTSSSSAAETFRPYPDWGLGEHGLVCDGFRPHLSRQTRSPQGGYPLAR
jgi:uncharacterized protein (TIGR03437 family)